MTSIMYGVDMGAKWNQNLITKVVAFSDFMKFKAWRNEGRGHIDVPERVAMSLLSQKHVSLCALADEPLKKMQIHCKVVSKLKRMERANA